MLEHSSQLHKLAMALPDIPRWVETRAMLLSNQCEIFGLKEVGELSFVVSSTKTKLISIVGHPDKNAIETVARNNNQGEILTPPESSNHVAEILPDWTPKVALLHLLGDTLHLPHIPEGAVRLLAPEEIDFITLLPSQLKAELKIASETPIAVTVVDNRPVSFCYAASQTESLWDISIDTLADHRNRSYAAMSVAFMIDYMSKQGKQPVWGAEELNVPSMRLAAKLGFVPMDQIYSLAKVS